MSHNLAVITVVYKNYSILDEFFDSFDRQTSKKFVIYVVDLTEHPREFKHPSYVQVLQSENKGYAYGINIGIKKAIQDGLDLFAVVNSDITVAKNFVKNSITRIIEKPWCFTIFWQA